MTSKTLAPSPPANILTGHLNGLRKDVLGLMLAGTRDHGDIVRYRIGPLTIHLVNHPDFISHVLVKNRQNYDKQSRSSAALRLICGESLLTANSASWKKRRRIIQPMFHQQAIEGFLETISECTNTMLDDWSEKAARGAPVEVASEMMKLTFRIVGLCLFGTELAREAATVEDAMHTLVSHTYIRYQSILSPPAFLPTPANRRFKKALAEVDEIVAALITSHRSNPPAVPDLLTMLLEGKDAETSEPISDQDIRNEAIAFLLAGHETTANSLAWSLHLLSTHPEAAREVATEFSETCGTRQPTMADLPSLKKALHVFEESNRLYPPIWAMERRAIEHDEIGGYHIPKGSGVIISPYALHRHPAFWNDPETFDPTRFETHDHPAYLPFGAGQRFCIGKEFALAEARIILPSILQRFKIHPLPDQLAEPEPAITLRIRNGLKIHLTPR